MARGTTVQPYLEAFYNYNSESTEEQQPPPQPQFTTATVWGTDMGLPPDEPSSVFTSLPPPRTLGQQGSWLSEDPCYLIERDVCSRFSNNSSDKADHSTENISLKKSRVSSRENGETCAVVIVYVCNKTKLWVWSTIKLYMFTICMMLVCSKISHFKNRLCGEMCKQYVNISSVLLIEEVSSLKSFPPHYHYSLEHVHTVIACVHVCVGVGIVIIQCPALHVWPRHIVWSGQLFQKRSKK